VKRLIAILGAVVLWPLPASRAQLAPPNEMGVSIGHLHVIARDLEAEKKVWVGLGGTPIKIDGTDVIKFPGIFVFLTRGVPAYSQAPGSGVKRFQVTAGIWGVLPSDANNEGNVINHIGFRLKAGSGILEKLEAAGVIVVLDAPEEPDDGVVYTSESMRIDTGQDANQKELVVAEHFHFDMPKYSRPEALNWYVKVFGVKARTGGEGDSASGDIPGLTRGITFGLNFGSPNAPLPSKGHTLDHIGFEVVNLEAFCKKLQGMGIR